MVEQHLQNYLATQSQSQGDNTRVLSAAANANWGEVSAFMSEFGLESSTTARVGSLSSSPSLLRHIPSLNTTPTEQIAAGSLVRFRCMVQDTLYNEYYPGIYEMKHKQSKEVKLCTGRYVDFVDIPDEYECDFDHASAPHDRLLLNCISMNSFQSSWLNTATDEANIVSNGTFATTDVNTSAASAGNKRRMDHDSDCAMNAPQDKKQHVQASVPAPASTSAMKDNADITTTASNISPSSTPARSLSSSSSSLPTSLNNMSCIVKVYNTEESALKIGTAVEFIGILSTAAEFNSFSGQSGMDSGMQVRMI